MQIDRTMVDRKRLRLVFLRFFMTNLLFAFFELGPCAPSDLAAVARPHECRRHLPPARATHWNRTGQKCLTRIAVIGDGESGNLTVVVDTGGNCLERPWHIQCGEDATLPNEAVVDSRGIQIEAGYLAVVVDA